jgi:transmembrane sensor
MEFRAVGTAFLVQLHSERVEMVVTEGRVAVDRAATADAASSAGASIPSHPAPLAIVEAGQQVAMDLPTTAIAAPPRVTALTSAESAEKLAWRVPRLELKDTPLSEAVTQINRHSAVRLELGDAELGKVEVSGLLRADNIEPLLRMLENNYDLQIDRREAGKIVLRRNR